MYALYTILLTLSGLLSWPYLLWRSFRGAGYHRDWLERFGCGATQRHAGQHAPNGLLWCHAASVGEVQGLQPIIAELQKRFPALPVVCSTFTPTGKMMAKRLVPSAVSVFLLPFDLPWVMPRLMRRLQPQALIVQETELWPNCLRAAARQGVPVIVVNGRLSPRSARRYRWVRLLMRRVLSDVTLILAQTQESARRFQALGAVAQRLKVVGNTNVDRALLATSDLVTPHVLTMLTKGRRVWVGGSTHEGEEALLLEAYRRVLPHHPDVLLVLAPRHLERVEAVVRQIQAANFRVVRRSVYDAKMAEALTGDAVVMLDTLGELVPLYGLCTVAFVGGSLVPIGGHNILEPAMFAKPLLFGPYMHHFPELAQMLCAAGGAIQVADVEALYQQVVRLLQQPGEAELIGQRAYQALQANRGALAAVVDDIACRLRRSA
jgi:3-deoxy-D-manno-octulosonic-acid transferase